MTIVAGRITASNPRVPARSPRLCTPALTRPPTGAITRGKTNKEGYYTLLMKDTGGERGQDGHQWNKRALTDLVPLPFPSLVPLTPSPPPSAQTKPATSTKRMPPRCVTPEWRDGGVGGAVEVVRGRGLHGLLIEWSHWGSMWLSGGHTRGQGCAVSGWRSRSARWEDAGRSWAKGTVWIFNHTLLKTRWQALKSEFYGSNSWVFEASIGPNVPRVAEKYGFTRTKYAFIHPRGTG